MPIPMVRAPRFSGSHTCWVSSWCLASATGSISSSTDPPGRRTTSTSTACLPVRSTGISLPPICRTCFALASRVVTGRITSSTILRKLGTYSRKNRLDQAFRELGVAVRSGFLLQYLGDAELRSTIQAATNKSESFNSFVQWLAFGGSVITENDRGEQRKIIKYNHLLANCLIFHNVCMMTRVLHKLRADGVPVEADTVAALSPYIRSHINSYLDIFSGTGVIRRRMVGALVRSVRPGRRAARRGVG